MNDEISRHTCLSSIKLERTDMMMMMDAKRCASIWSDI